MKAPGRQRSGALLLRERPARNRRRVEYPGRPLQNFRMASPAQQTLSELLVPLLQGLSVPQQAFAQAPATPGELGLIVRAGRVWAPAGLEALSPARIRAALTPAAAAWLRDLQVLAAVDSTNARMLEAAGRRSIEGAVWFAELQTAGRGRRGRRWIAPFGRSLAVSLGFALSGPPKEAGPLSLVAGLALADLLDRLGIPQVALKWPNDLLIGTAKAGGILLESRPKQGGLECVLGVGLNLGGAREIQAAIGQEAADLQPFGAIPGRNALAAGLISSLVRFVEEFKRAGFGGMRQAYDQIHICRGRRCRVQCGNEVCEGIALGIGEGGELRLLGPGGERRFSGGEVSLRIGAGLGDPS